MDLSRAISLLDPQTVVYIGCGPEKVYIGCGPEKATNNGIKPRYFNCSGFFYIGYARDAPVSEYGHVNVTDVYDREADYPGKVILVNALIKGNFWFWHEYDSNVPFHETPLVADPEPYENILVQIMKNDIGDYRSALQKEVKKTKPSTMEELNFIIGRFRKKFEKALEFESETNIGEYLISAVEDEVRTYWLHPEVKKIPDYDKKYKRIKEERRRLVAERTKANEASHYASIKGKSVYHGREGK